MCKLFIAFQVKADMASMSNEFQDWAWQETLRATEGMAPDNSLPDLDDVDGALCGV